MGDRHRDPSQCMSGFAGCEIMCSQWHLVDSPASVDSLFSGEVLEFGDL